VHSLFSVVLFVVCGLGIVAALWSLLGAGKAWEAYTERGLVMERVPSAGPGAASPGALEAERDDEIRQLVDAANHRRARRGEAPLDVDAEIARLTAADAASDGPLPRPVDPEVADEVRTLVELRNRRRLRQGLDPLDVEAEIQRGLAALGGPEK
jgi:hypothetical protein